MQVLLSALKCLCTYAVHLARTCASFVRWFSVFLKCMFLLNIFPVQKICDEQEAC
jgi:hypothetical protein